MHLDLKTAGDSHGPGLTMILSGMPAGLPFDAGFIAVELARRRSGPGRSVRQDRESDDFQVQGGVYRNLTTGAPIAVAVPNRVQDEGTPTKLKRMRVPRPGHADLAGALKYGLDDIRPVAERASARETAARVVGGAICKLLLRQLEISVCSRILSVGEHEFPWEPLYPTNEQVVEAPGNYAPNTTHISEGGFGLMEEIFEKAEASGYNLGAVIQIIGIGLPPGLGSHVDWKTRLDGRIGRAFLSVPAVKGIDIGDPGVHRMKSVHAQDQIVPDESYPWITRRTTNRAGGLEGGCTDGEPVVVTARFKPIPTSDEPLNSVELRSGRGALTTTVRHDVCPAIGAATILENMLALVLADACLEKFGGDALSDIIAAREHYLTRLRNQEKEEKDHQRQKKE